MIDDVSDIAALYNSDPEKEAIRLEQHQLYLTRSQIAVF